MPGDCFNKDVTVTQPFWVLRGTHKTDLADTEHFPLSVAFTFSESNEMLI